MHSRWVEAPAFGDLLAAIIESTGLSQRELAVLAGVSHSQISRWKAGEHQPGYSPMMRLGTALRKEHPELGDLTPKLLLLAGYPSPALTDEERAGMAAITRAAEVFAEQRGRKSSNG